MARRVYFAFHYQNDIFRVNVVRKSGFIRGSDEAGFYDSSLWESAKKTSDDAIKRMINNGLDGTSVTVFLLGSETARRPWVCYELEQSASRGNGLLAVHINQIPDVRTGIGVRGQNILDNYTLKDVYGQSRPLSFYYKTYDWVANNGYQNFGLWVEEAAKIAGK